MERMISVKDLLKKNPELDNVMGYSEAMLEDLVLNGHMPGHYDSQSGELMVDASECDDLVSICRNIMSDYEFEEEYRPAC